MPTIRVPYATASDPLESSREILAHVLTPKIAEKCRTVADAVGAIRRHLPCRLWCLPGDTDTLECLQDDLERILEGLELYERPVGESHVAEDVFYQRFLIDAVHAVADRARWIQEKRPGPPLPPRSTDPLYDLKMWAAWCTTAIAKPEPGADAPAADARVEYSVPMSLVDMANRLGNMETRKFKMLASKNWGLERRSKKTWVVRLDMMDANTRGKIEKGR